MPLLTLLTTNHQIHQVGGLNWGYGLANHTRQFDAYIPIHIGTIRSNPGFFRPKTARQTILDFTWDDGTRMQGLFEGSQPDRLTGLIYPKQISSYPNKDILGRYFRRRLGVGNNRRITLQDLRNYGRSDVTITRINATHYNLDFA